METDPASGGKSLINDVAVKRMRELITSAYVTVSKFRKTGGSNEETSSYKAIAAFFQGSDLLGVAIRHQGHGEPASDHAGNLEGVLFFGSEPLELCFDHPGQAFRHVKIDFGKV